MSDRSHASSEERRQAVTEALRGWDPEADVAVEAGTGRLKVLTTLPADRVAALLREAGELGGCAGEGVNQCCGRCSR